MKIIAQILSMVLMCMTVAVNAAPHCRPPLVQGKQNFLIGYGSLMQSASRRRTNPRAVNVYPIMVRGFERVWGIRSHNYYTTMLTIIKNKRAQLNAVYYPVMAQDITQTDAREGGYCRVNVPREQLSALGLKTLPPGVFWVYAQKDNHVSTPNAHYPIVQSYVDLFIGGCLQVGRAYQVPDFAARCVQTTTAWPKVSVKGAWINDRVHPHRPFDQPDSFAIDRLLARYFSNYYQHAYQ